MKWKCCCSKVFCLTNQNYVRQACQKFPTETRIGKMAELMWFEAFGRHTLCPEALQEAIASYLEAIPEADWASLLVDEAWSLEARIYWAEQLRGLSTN